MNEVLVFHVSTAANITNHDTRSFDMAMLNPGLTSSCARSMPLSFDRKRGVRHGVVCAHVMRHCVAAVVYVSRDSDVGETKSVWHARVSQRADFRLPF